MTDETTKTRRHEARSWLRVFVVEMILRLVASSWLLATGLALVVVQAQDAKPSRSVWDGVYNTEQAERGKSQYMESCASCHSKDLRGDNTAPSLVDESFAFQWDDTTVGELFTRIRTLMPSDRPNSLSPQRYRNVVAFILQANKFPAGEKELDADALNQILISTKRPPQSRP
jgi:mono/diheme cytochrome c family protein